VIGGGRTKVRVTVVGLDEPHPGVELAAVAVLVSDVIIAGPATRMPHQRVKSGAERTTTVNSRILMSCTSPAQAA